jgi:endonuclease/exonuclease/phosphatase family metal-dependent hydrolase
VSTVRLATLNIWHRLGPWPDRLRLIRREIERLRPAVLGLQEVLRDGGADGQARDRAAVPVPNQAEEIAEGLGYRVAYGRAGAAYLGNALLSRFPIGQQRTFELPDFGTGEHRSMLYAVVDTPLGALPVFVTHLNWRLDHGFVRLAQVRFILARIDELVPMDGDTLPPVLLGDLNAEPDSDELRFLRGLSVVEGRSTYFADAWIYAGDGTPGTTYDRRNDYARTAREPSRRIDYILVRGPDSALRGEPVHTELAFTLPEMHAGERVWPSDHFGLYSDVWLAPREY